MMAGIIVGFYFVLHLVEPTLNYKVSASFMIGIFHILAGIFFVRKAILDQKAANDGAISFGEAFATGFGTIAIALSLFHTIKFLHLMIDPHFYETITQYTKEQAIEMITSVTETFNMKGDDFDKAMAEVDKQNFDIGIGTYILGLLSGLVWPGAVLSVIMAAVIKKH